PKRRLRRLGRARPRRAAAIQPAPALVPPPVFAQLTCEPGGVDADLIRREVDEWISSDALRALVTHFGGTAEAIADLVTFSDAWDFRGGVLERYDTERINY